MNVKNLCTTTPSMIKFINFSFIIQINSNLCKILNKIKHLYFKIKTKINSNNNYNK